MPTDRPTVCLNMIVKDEAHVIERCLTSIKPFVDAWLIVDTGSSDDTVDVIEAIMGDLPGEVVSRPWRDFGHNRSEALELARAHADFVLVIDADEVWEAPDDFRFPSDMSDGVQIQHVTAGGTSFFLTTLMRSSLPWRYVGVLHEVADCPIAHTVQQLTGPRVVGHFDSARNQRPQREKYLADAEVLTRAVADDPTNERYAFYLAQSLRDAGEIDAAIEWYERRMAMPGWPEETWYATQQVAILKERRGDPLASVVDAFLLSHDTRPTRAEPLHDLARVNRLAGRYTVALDFARLAMATERPDDILFLDEDVYAWRVRDELALAAFHCGDNETAIRVGSSLVDDPVVPESQRQRLRDNLTFYVAD